MLLGQVGRGPGVGADAASCPEPTPRSTPRGQPLLAPERSRRYLPPVQTLLRRAVALALALLPACGQPAPAPAPDVAAPCAPAVAPAAAVPLAPAPAAPTPAPPPERDSALPPLGVAPVNAPSPPSHVRWIVAGGGATPVDNQVSIEDDLALATETFDGAGVLLFAGGAGTHGVQVLDPSPRGDRLTALLGDLFDPRGGRDTHYQPTRLEPNGPATGAALLDALGAALERPDDGPLTVYLAGHGVPAARPADVQLALWGGVGLLPRDLAEALDTAPRGLSGRQVRLVMTSCFSGAFADVLFTSADPTRGAATDLRCGLFASTWDRPSSGCDPDPAGRRLGYGALLLRALAGRGVDGAPLDAATLDLDHDGRVSLLEAHTHARTAATGFDVPTTTSERWLRHVATSGGWAVPLVGADTAPSAPVTLPEEDAVIAALGPRLEATDELAVSARVAELQRDLAELDQAIASASEAEAEAADRIAAETLARWPVLDDPWHPDYAATLATERPAIEGWFKAHADYHAYVAAKDATDRASARRDDVQLALGPWLTLQRAHETRRLAGHLAARGGAELTTFNALRACERGLAP